MHIMGCVCRNKFFELWAAWFCQGIAQVFGSHQITFRGLEEAFPYYHEIALTGGYVIYVL